MNLKKKALKGFEWIATASIVKAITQLLQILILARILAKEDFGVFAILMVVIGFAKLFVEAGLNSAVIHLQQITKDQLANAYTINLALGFFVFVVVFLLAYPISYFYSEPVLIELIQVTAFVFVIQPWGLQYAALFQKDLQFKLLAKLGILSGLTLLLISAMLAMEGFGVYSLVWAYLCNALLQTVLLMGLGVKRYGFKLSLSWEVSRYFVHFGLFQIGEKSINYFNTQIDVLLVGKFFGQEILGGYYMAKQLVMRPASIINPVITKIAFPIFAKVQGDTVRLKTGYLKMTQVLMTVNFPIYLLVAGFSNEISLLFLGGEWEETGLIISILAFYFMQRALLNPVSSLLLAKGQVKIGFYWNLSLLITTTMVVLASSLWGVVGVSIGLVLLTFLYQIPSWYFLVHKVCGASFSEYFVKLAQALILAMLCFSPIFVIDDILLKFLLALLGGICYSYINRSTFLLVVRK